MGLAKGALESPWCPGCSLIGTSGHPWRALASFPAPPTWVVLRAPSLSSSSPLARPGPQPPPPDHECAPQPRLLVRRVAMECGMCLDRPFMVVLGRWALPFAPADHTTWGRTTARGPEEAWPGAGPSRPPSTRTPPPISERTTQGASIDSQLSLCLGASAPPWAWWASGQPPPPRGPRPGGQSARRRRWKGHSFFPSPCRKRGPHTRFQAPFDPPTHAPTPHRHRQDLGAVFRGPPGVKRAPTRGMQQH